jgi:hypothetical protein
MPGSRKQISRWRKVFCKGRFFGSELEEAAARLLESERS